MKVLVIACEVEDGAADDYVGEIIRERHLFYEFNSKIVRGKSWRKLRGETTNLGDRSRVGVHAENLVSLSKQVDQVAPGSASGIEHAHSASNSATQELIEQIDVNLAELLLKVGHEAVLMIRESLSLRANLYDNLQMGSRVVAVLFSILLTPAVKAQTTAEARGRDVFRACGGCHNVLTDARRAGPSLRTLFGKVRLINGKRALEQNVRDLVTEGYNGMPSYKNLLRPQDWEDLMAYLKTLRGRPEINTVLRPISRLR